MSLNFKLSLCCKIKGNNNICRAILKWKASSSIDETDQVLIPLMVDNLTDSSFKGSAIANNIFVLMKAISYKGKYRWKELEHKVFSFYQGIAFPRHHYLFSTFNEKIQQLTTGGFINYWQEKWTKHRNVTEKIPEPEPKVLDVERLSIGFQIWLIMLGISLIAFIGEIVHYWAPKLYHVVVFYCILNCFYKLIKYPH